MTSLRWRGPSRWLLAVLALAIAPPTPAVAAASGPYSIRWNPVLPGSHRVAVELSGLGAGDSEQLQRASRTSAQWQALFSVFAEQGDVVADATLPPMQGSYRIESAILRFEPQFPLDVGVRYRAVFRPAQLPAAKSSSPVVTGVFQLPRLNAAATSVVRQLYPTAEVLPENLLKFYVHFSAPMRRGHIYDHIHLRDDRGKAIELPFLEIDEELWDPTMTRLTLFIDPGRIKQGVLPLEEIGPALENGKRYTLEIDRAWQDATGRPLKESFRKSFRVGPPDRVALNPGQWTITGANPGVREPVTIAFPKPMDHALALRMIRVVDASGAALDGTVQLADHERRWSFTPAANWRPGKYRLLIQNTIEDLSGNNIGKAFEVDLFEGIQRRITQSTVSLDFEIR